MRRSALPASAALIALAAAAGLLLVEPSRAYADLAAARTLYASASYEEALAALGGPDAEANVEQAHQLRALCLLALGRTKDAQQALAQIVMDNPLYEIPAADVSPKLVAMFHEVRRETLPAAARTLYGRAKESYDAKKWTVAREQFSRLLALLGAPDATAQSSALADLKQLGDGFLKLTDSELAAEERRAAEAAALLAAEKAAADEAARAAAARAAEPAATPVGTSGATAPAGTGNAGTATSASRAAAAGVTPATRAAIPARPAAAPVFSAADLDVVRPTELRRVMPRWIPPTREMGQMSHSGLLELVIDEAGSVAEATVTKPISPAYDQSLRDLARTWRYRPATREGQPVRYRIVLEIVLKPAE